MPAEDSANKSKWNNITNEIMLFFDRVFKDFLFKENVVDKFKITLL